MIDLVITDYQMPGLDDLSLMPLLRESLPSAPVIVLAGNGNVDSYYIKA
jgi:CheY-like chemotaxis protein